MKDSTDKYKHCNHHHEVADKHELVDFGDGKFVGFATSAQPKIFWAKYIGSKKCDMCDKSADLQAIKDEKIIGYSCDDHNFDMFKE